MSIPTGPPGVRPLTLGLELEFVAYGTRVDIKRAINTPRLRKLFDPPVVVSAIGNWDGEGGVEKWTVWLVKNDSSIVPGDPSPEGIMAEAVELISSILKDDGVEAVGGWRWVVKGVLWAIRDAGIKIFVNKDTQTGLHVHVGVGKDHKFTLDEVKKVSALFLVYEHDIDHYHAEHRCREVQCQSNRDNCVFSNCTTAEALEMIMGYQTLQELTLAMCPLGISANGEVVAADRQYKLNLLSLSLHGTLEWRQHDGTTDAAVVCGWADFVLHFVRSALKLSFDEIMEYEREGRPLIPAVVPANIWPRH